MLMYEIWACFRDPEHTGPQTSTEEIGTKKRFLFTSRAISCAFLTPQTANNLRYPRHVIAQMEKLNRQYSCHSSGQCCENVVARQLGLKFPFTVPFQQGVSEKARTRLWGKIKTNKERKTS